MQSFINRGASENPRSRLSVKGWFKCLPGRVTEFYPKILTKLCGNRSVAFLAREDERKVDSTRNKLLLRRALRVKLIDPICYGLSKSRSLMEARLKFWIMHLEGKHILLFDIAKAFPSVNLDRALYFLRRKKIDTKLVLRDFRYWGKRVRARVILQGLSVSSTLFAIYMSQTLLAGLRKTYQLNGIFWIDDGGLGFDSADQSELALQEIKNLLKKEDSFGSHLRLSEKVDKRARIVQPLQPFTKLGVTFDSGRMLPQPNKSAFSYFETCRWIYPKISDGQVKSERSADLLKTLERTLPPAIRIISKCGPNVGCPLNWTPCSRSWTSSLEEINKSLPLIRRFQPHRELSELAIAGFSRCAFSGAREAALRRAVEDQQNSIDAMDILREGGYWPAPSPSSSRELTYRQPLNEIWGQDMSYLTSRIRKALYSFRDVPQDSQLQEIPLSIDEPPMFCEDIPAILKEQYFDWLVNETWTRFHAFNANLLLSVEYYNRRYVVTNADELEWVKRCTDNEFHLIHTFNYKDHFNCSLDEIAAYKPAIQRLLRIKALSIALDLRFGRKTFHQTNEIKWLLSGIYFPEMHLWKIGVLLKAFTQKMIKEADVEAGVQRILFIAKSHPKNRTHQDKQFAQDYHPLLKLIGVPFPNFYPPDDLIVEPLES